MQKLRKFRIFRQKIKKCKNKQKIIKLKLVIYKKNIKNWKNQIKWKNKEVMNLFLLWLNYKIRSKN